MSDTTAKNDLLDQAEHYKNILFDLEEPVELSVEEFDAFWPLIKPVWTESGVKTLQQNGTVEVQYFKCYLHKSRSISTETKDGTTIQKTVRVKDLCQAGMKMTRTTTEPITVILERSNNDSHTHDLEEAFRLRGMCHICGEQPTGWMGFRWHNENFHQDRVQIIFKDNFIKIVARDPETHMFSCPCGNFSTSKPTGLKTHARSHAGRAATALPESEFPELASLDTDTLLDELHIAIIPGFEIAVCKLCRTGLFSDRTFANHIINIHNEKYHHDTLRKIFSQHLKCCTEYVLPVDIIPAIPELPIHNGFACLAEGCNYASGMKTTMLVHCKTQHGVKTIFREHTVQRFAPHSKSAWFPVSTDALDDADLLDSNPDLDELVAKQRMEGVRSRGAQERRPKIKLERPSVGSNFSALVGASSEETGGTRKRTRLEKITEEIEDPSYSPPQKRARSSRIVVDLTDVTDDPPTVDRRQGKRPEAGISSAGGTKLQESGRKKLPPRFVKLPLPRPIVSNSPEAAAPSPPKPTQSTQHPQNHSTPTAQSTPVHHESPISTSELLSRFCEWFTARAVLGLQGDAKADMIEKVKNAQRVLQEEDYDLEGVKGLNESGWRTLGIKLGLGDRMRRSVPEFERSRRAQGL